MMSRIDAIVFLVGTLTIRLDEALTREVEAAATRARKSTARFAIDALTAAVRDQIPPAVGNAAGEAEVRHPDSLLGSWKARALTNGYSAEWVELCSEPSVGETFAVPERLPTRPVVPLDE